MSDHFTTLRSKGLISKLKVIMFVLVPLMETQKHLYRQTCQSTIVKLRETTVGMKPKEASEHVRKTLGSAANAP